MLYTKHGVTLDIAEPYIFDEAVEPLVKLGVPPVVVDIGANAGSLAIYAAKHGARHVLAVEPVLFDRLVKNIYNNGVQDIVTPLPFAVRANRKPTSMRRVTTDGQVGHCFREARAPITCGTWTSIVPVQLFDLMQVPCRIDYLKLDIEGGEWELLRTGALEEVLKNTVVFDLELHDEGEFMEPGFTHKFNVLEYLQTLGFLTTEKEMGCKRVVMGRERD